jgi:anti-sigma regulatory factor (Ser/Thr protein kinase)
MPQTNTLSIGATPSAVRCARILTAGTLTNWEMTDLVEDATLVVSELVTNAVNASTDCDDVAVWLWTDGESVLIEVRDSAPGIPLLVEATPDEDCGRGLLLVAALSKDRGAVPAGAGKVVWASLSA